MTRSLFVSRCVPYALLFALGGCARHVDPPRSSARAPAPLAAAPPLPAPAPSQAGSPTPPPSAPPGHPVTAAERAEVIDHLIAELDHLYLFPDKARALGTMLRGRLARHYATIATGEELARTITEDMSALVHDKHLEVRYFEDVIPQTKGEPPPGMAAEEAAEQRYLNHGVFEVRRLKFNLGYLDLNAFGRPPAAADKLAAAMRLVADTASLIIDLRSCHGGDTDMVTIAESYFVPAGTHLLDMYTRSDNRTEHVHAAATLAGPRYAPGKPVFVLIGEDTASGCEGFAYALQSQRRATVIGAPSAGAAYFGDPRRLSDHFMAFVPIGRPIDPITHGDWEGTGVTPTLVVPPARALEVAERRSLELLAPNEPSRRRREAMQKRITELSHP